MDELRGDLAVDSTWNGDHGLIAFTPSVVVKAWRGTAASQPASEGNGQYLRCGGDQIWVPAGKHHGDYVIGRVDLR